LKLCTKCEERKPLVEFESDKRNKDGKGSQCLLCKRARAVVYRSNNKRKCAQYSKKYNEENKESVSARKQKWRENNRHISCANLARYRASKSNRTPDFDQEGIPFHYELAKSMTNSTGKLWTVDHAIPLRGELVSGLHVAENLQVMLGSKNFSKDNSFPLA